MSKKINVTVPLPGRPTEEPLPGDDGSSTLHVCLEGKDTETGKRAYFTLEMEPFSMPTDKSTVVVLQVVNPDRRETTVRRGQ
jgi:hypothetical protein